MVAVDVFVAAVGLIAGTSGSIFSVMAILDKFAANSNPQVLYNVTQHVENALINSTVIGIHP